MIGTNVLILNQATICNAIQYWLNDSVLQDNGKVSNVSYNAADLTFNVKLAEIVEQA